MNKCCRSGASHLVTLEMGMEMVPVVRAPAVPEPAGLWSLGKACGYASALFPRNAIFNL